MSARRLGTAPESAPAKSGFTPPAGRLIAVAVTFGERRATQRKALERITALVFAGFQLGCGNVNDQLLLLFGFAGPRHLQPFGQCLLAPSDDGFPGVYESASVTGEV